MKIEHTEDSDVAFIFETLDYKLGNLIVFLKEEDEVITSPDCQIENGRDSMSQVVDRYMADGHLGTGR